MKSHQKSLNSTKWKRKILKIYWSFFIIYLVAESVSFVFGWSPDPLYVVSYFYNEAAVPLSTIIVCILILEFLCLSYFERIRNLDYIFIVAGTVIAGSLVITNSDIPVMQAVMIVPLSLSALFFDKRKILFSTALNLVFIFFYYFFINKDTNDDLLHFSIIVFSFILIACCTAGMIVVNRGAELLQDLGEKIRSEAILRAEREWMEVASKIDGLTGLANHKSFYENMDRMIEAYQRNKDPLHLALVDIDNFKSINDTYGHWVGDIVLNQVAGKLTEILHPHAFISRYGGEEFGILFQGFSDSEVVERLEEARGSIELIRFPEINDATVTVSIGMHMLNETETKEKFFKLTDKALYKAKASGKNRICTIGYSE